MKFLKSVLFAVVIFTLYSPFVFAGEYLARNAIVTHVANTSSNEKNFAIQVSGGSIGTCSGKWIVFPESAAANSAAHQRAYSTALTALTTGLKVQIHNYTNGTCSLASYIEIVK